MIQSIFACSVRRVKRFWHILLLDDSCKNVKDVSLFSDNLYILFINNCLYIFINSILMRLKSHYCSLVIASLFIGTWSIVRWPLNNCSFAHEECFNHARSKMAGFSCYFIRSHTSFYLLLLIMEEECGKFVKLKVNDHLWNGHLPSLASGCLILKRVSMEHGTPHWLFLFLYWCALRVIRAFSSTRQWLKSRD